jgi:hypothetical protein
MHHSRPGLLEALDFALEVGQVSGQQRGTDQGEVASER